MLGANVLEKHVSLRLGEKRADFEAAINVDMLRNIKEKMVILNKTKGDSSLEIGKYESAYSRNGPMKFTIVANRDLKKDEIINKNDITFRRTREINTIKQIEFLNLIGGKIKEDIPKYSLVNWKKVKK